MVALFRGKVRGLGCLLKVGIWLMVAALPSAQAGKVAEDPESKITVRLVSHAHVSPERLTQAKREATILFRRLGVDIEWLDCRSWPSDPESAAACETPAGLEVLVLRILPNSKSAPAGVRDTVGSAIIPKDGRPGAFASVFYDRVEEFSASSQGARSVVLGHAMAHEIGHLLLGRNEHAPRGLMRAHWDREDLHQATQRYLTFSEQEARLIRAAVVRRTMLARSVNEAVAPGQ